MPVGHDHQGRGEQIDAERNRRDRLDLAGLSLRTEQEAGHDQRGGQRKSRDDAERVRREQAGLAHSHQRPQHAERDGGDGEPAPHADAGEAERRRGDDGDVDVERPVVRLVGGDQHRRDECADDAEARERRAVQQRCGKRRERDKTERDEGCGGCEKVVQRVGGIDGAERDRGAGGREDRRNVGDRQRCDGGDRLLAAGPFAGGKQRCRKQSAEEHARGGAEQAGFDRVAHEEKSAQRKRQAADPDHPARAEALFEARRCAAEALPLQAAAGGSSGSGGCGQRFRLGWRLCDRLGLRLGRNGRRERRFIGRGSGDDGGARRRAGLELCEPRLDVVQLVARRHGEDERGNREAESQDLEHLFSKGQGMS